MNNYQSDDRRHIEYCVQTVFFYHVDNLKALEIIYDTVYAL